MQILRNLSETVFDDLCESTDISANLLTKLKIHGVIKPELCGQIGAEFDPKSKALILYNFLKKHRTNEDYPKLKEALKDSGNAYAINILNQAEQELRNNPGSSGMIQPAVPNLEASVASGGSAATLATTIKLFEVVGILSDNEPLIKNVHVLYKRFPKVKLADVTNYTRPRDIIHQVLSTWRGQHKETDSNVGKLVEILEKDVGGENFVSAAEALKKMARLDAPIDDK